MTADDLKWLLVFGAVLLIILAFVACDLWRHHDG